MKYYQEIRLIDGEWTLYALWSLLYGQLHFCLATLEKSGGQNIGVSFPDYSFREYQNKVFSTLGDKLRLFADDEMQLKQMVEDLKSRLIQYSFDGDADDMGDSFHFKRIQPVPAEHSFVVVRRYRHKTLEKQAHDFAEHRGISMDEALAHCREHKRPAKPYPFIDLESQTNKVGYKLTIRQTAADTETAGVFNAYGINNATDKVTVPHW